MEAAREVPLQHDGEYGERGEAEGREQGRLYAEALPVDAVLGLLGGLHCCGTAMPAARSFASINVFNRAMDGDWSSRWWLTIPYREAASGF